jgi:hypothetical protein
MWQEIILYLGEGRRTTGLLSLNVPPVQPWWKDIGVIDELQPWSRAFSLTGPGRLSLRGVCRLPAAPSGESYKLVERAPARPHF